jgi:23S rRNA (adenine2030-N6)-methyltransferase
MNYRHAFHAGNFADVIKHAVLVRILLYLNVKPAAYRVIDTHAGAGLYDLASDEARRGAEWQSGIGRVFAAQAAGDLPDAVVVLLAPYLDAVRALNPADRLTHYPGSPLLARAIMRPQDRLVACELEPHAAAALARHLRDPRVKTLAIDGWTALTAYVPPTERRGLVLVDPPFEQPDEFARLAASAAEAHRKWATGCYVLWYPIKDRTGPDRLAKAMRRAGIGKALRAELVVSPPAATGPLAGSGLIVINPPWPLEAELKVMLPVLAQLLAREGTARGMWRLDWLTAETAN